MAYILKRAVLGCNDSIEIAPDEFQAILDAREILSGALTIEEQYLVLVSNYEELEKELMSHAVASTISLPQNYGDFHFARHIFNTRMINLLTAARLYADHLGHHIKLIMGEDAGKSTKELFSKQYDTFFEYRFMEALRNYVQHRGFPVHRTAHRGYLTEPISNDSRHVKVVDIYSQKKLLESDKRFKAEVQKEMAEEVNLKHATRQYIECMSAVHAEIRKIIVAKVQGARELIENQFVRYTAKYGEETLGLAVMEVDESGICNTKSSLTLEWDDVRLDLIARNRGLKNLNLTYASGE